jgi:glycerophosphoryl diester phosphodiesterase
MLPENFPVLVGHRGFSARFPENTLLSFQKAIECGINQIECDVHLTRDQQVVVIHDETLERTTNGRGQVSDFSVRELKKLDAGQGQSIPTLDELLTWAKQDSLIQVMIEIKSDPNSKGKIEEHVAELISRHHVLHQTRVISFDHALLSRLRLIDPAITIGTLFERVPQENYAQLIQVALDLKADSIWPAADQVDIRLVEMAHQSQLKVITWTVNDPVLLKKVAFAKVDGVVTDNPERIKSELSKI